MNSPINIIYNIIETLYYNRFSLLLTIVIFIITFIIGISIINNIQGVI